MTFSFYKGPMIQIAINQWIHEKCAKQFCTYQGELELSSARWKQKSKYETKL